MRLGAFELLRPLARGGMGVVWSGRHAPTGTPVAIKTLLPHRPLDERTRRELDREVRAVAALSHPHIVATWDRGQVPAQLADESGGQLRANAPWMALEYVPDGTLASVAGRTSWSWASSLLLQILDGLAHAHARGLIHRDIKPANVLLAGRRAKLTTSATDGCDASMPGLGGVVTPRRLWPAARTARTPGRSGPTRRGSTTTSSAPARSSTSC